ncbi:MAG: sigma-70 family RNA polymerase sigma factor [Desulfurellales bacterium]|nr:MAG: sigma-70 family RNA polymerase sigma factor [Desulfurellales bacterium]
MARRGSAAPPVRSQAERNKLVEENLPLARWAVLRFAPHAASDPHLYDDLLQAAYCGLLDAASRWVEGRCEFSTYAYHWLRRAVLVELRARDMIRIPQEHSGQRRREMRQRLACARLDVRRAHEAPWDTPGREPEPSEAMEQGERGADALHLLRGLTPREREAIALRFGLLDGEERTLQAVADAMGLSRMRVQQLERAACERLADAGIGA